MSEPTKKIKLSSGCALVFDTAVTRYVDEEGEIIAVLGFPVDETNAELVLKAYQAGYGRGFTNGQRQGRQNIVGVVHELLGIDKIIDALSSRSEGK